MTTNQYTFPLTNAECRALEETSRPVAKRKYGKHIGPAAQKIIKKSMNFNKIS